jgi:hypothetical protein
MTKDGQREKGCSHPVREVEQPNGVEYLIAEYLRFMAMKMCRTLEDD